MEATLGATAEQEQGCASPAGSARCRALCDGACCSTDVPGAQDHENEHAKGCGHGQHMRAAGHPRGPGPWRAVTALTSRRLGDHGYAWQKRVPSHRQDPRQPRAEQPVSVSELGVFPVPVSSNATLLIFGKSSAI